MWYQRSRVQPPSVAPSSPDLASGNPDEAEMEINHWFDKSEILDYRLVQEQILYDVNLDGKDE